MTHLTAPKSGTALKTAFLSGIALCAVMLACVCPSSSGTLVRKGVWVTVFSEKKVLYSREAAGAMVDLCEKNGITDIYLQLYRAGYAYYDSRAADRTKYERMLKDAGADMVDYITRLAFSNGVKVHAWINVLSLSQNDGAGMLKKYGNDVLTRDQHGHTSMAVENGKGRRGEFIDEKQLFLEPGDERVSGNAAVIAGEIVKRYPQLSGIHMDYIRYPYAVPFIPNGEFTRMGLSYGYGKRNVEAFGRETGLNAYTAFAKKDTALVWDNWKRSRVTEVVRRVAGAARKERPGIEISCAVMPSIERAYAIAFQDWPSWLEDGAVDFVVIMNYTIDDGLFYEYAKSASAMRGRGRVFVGIGAFLMHGKGSTLGAEYESLKRMNADGVVFFSYDNMPEIKDALLK